MKTELYNERIEAFLKGELSESEHSEIEERMKSDPEFRRLVELHRLAFEGMDFMLAKEVEQFLSPEPEPGLELEEHEAVVKPIWQRPYFRRAMAVAAAVVAIAVVALEFVVPQVNQERNINRWTQADREVNFDVAGENDEILSNAQKAFNRGEFSNAVELFDQYLESSEQSDPEVSLYRGIALRLAGRPEEAIQVFQGLVNTAEQHYSGDEASWQLALAYLQQEDYTSCRAQLRKIIQDKGNTKRAEAKKILRAIRFK